MIAYGDNIKVFCGNSNPAFAQTICKELGIKLGQSTVVHSLTVRLPYPWKKPSVALTFFSFSPPASPSMTI